MTGGDLSRLPRRARRAPAEAPLRLDDDEA